MLEVFFAADVKSDPARVGNPSVLLCKTFRQESISNWTRKGYINDAALVRSGETPDCFECAESVMLAAV
jgi:hypothetical protein